MPTASREIIVSNLNGLHARPAMQFVDTASKYSAEIKVIKGGDDPMDADGKSIMQMISLAAEQGTSLRIEANGVDAEPAVKELAELFESKFGEE
jgi:phosphocarrier protein HPr